MNQKIFLITQLFFKTFVKWLQDECIERGAALAYYALFSLFPICLVILSIFGLILGPDTNIYLQILTFAKSALPTEAYSIVENTLLHLNQRSIGAGLTGFGLLLLTASRIFSVLDNAVERIWQVNKNPQKPRSIGTIIYNFILNKVSSLALVLVAAIFLWLSLISNIIVRIILEIVNNFQQSNQWFELDEIFLYRGLETMVTVGLLFVGVMCLFKFLPSTTVKWSDVWLGSLFTVLLMMTLQRLVSNGIVRLGEQFKAYGAIGGVMVLLLWLYFTFQIFFLGCELTYIYTYLFGSRRHLKDVVLRPKH